MSMFRDITGMKFGKLRVQSRVSQSKNGTWKWSTMCDCGRSEVVFLTQLTSGSKVCCRECRRAKAAEERTTHGMRNTPEYRTWRAIKARCRNENFTHYKDYGGRGIEVCDEWYNSFETFFADMGSRPSGTSIERSDVNGNYEPGNCTWRSAKVQANNRRNATKVTLNGETLSITEWSERTGIPRSTILWRIRNNFTPDRVLKITETAA